MSGDLVQEVKRPNSQFVCWVCWVPHLKLDSSYSCLPVRVAAYGLYFNPEDGNSCVFRTYCFRNCVITRIDCPLFSFVFRCYFHRLPRLTETTNCRPNSIYGPPEQKPRTIQTELSYHLSLLRSLRNNTKTTGRLWSRVWHVDTTHPIALLFPPANCAPVQVWAVLCHWTSAPCFFLGWSKSSLAFG
jgi:hypothetical protein